MFIVLEVLKSEEDFIRANASKSGILAGLWSYYQRKGGLTQTQLNHVTDAMGVDRRIGKP